MASQLRVVVVSDTFKIDPLALDDLKSADFEVVPRFDLASTGRAGDMITALKGAWAVIAGAEAYPDAVLRHIPSLRAIARPGIGTDAIDIGAATRRGIAVLVTRGANVDAVADHAVTLMLAGRRRLLDLDQRTRRGSWRPPTLGLGLTGATVGLLGLGAIGRAVARRLTGFNCSLIATESEPDKAFCAEFRIQLMSLQELLPLVDILSIHVPLSPSTRGLIGRVELEAMREQALVVNTARGGIVDEVALIAALETGQIGGAALDVYEQEPLRPDDPLVFLPNVILSPHFAAFTVESVRRMIEGTVENLVALRAGNVPRGCTNVVALNRHGLVTLPERSLS